MIKLSKLVASLLIWLLLFSIDIYSQTNALRCSISGELRGLPENSYLYLTRNINGQKKDTLANSSSRNGIFRFENIPIKEGELLYIRLDSSLSKKLKPIYVTYGNIEITGTADNWPFGIEVSGSSPHEDYETLLELLAEPLRDIEEIRLKILSLSNKMDSAKFNQTFHLLDTIRYKDSLIELKNIRGQLVAEYYRLWEEWINLNLHSLYTPHAILKLKRFTVFDMEKYYSKLSENSRSSYYGGILRETINTRKLRDRIGIGRTAPDFVSKTPNGEPVSLLEIVKKGKVTLVDFGGSWCKPCREEIPFIRKVYDEFHKMGFNVIGVSLEYSAEEWEKSIKEENIPWLQVSEIKGRQEMAASIYSVNGVPAYLLLDKSGKILSIDLPGSGIPIDGYSLRGDGLYRTISKLLSN